MARHSSIRSAAILTVCASLLVAVGCDSDMPKKGNPASSPTVNSKDTSSKLPSKAELRKRLTPMQFEVTQNDATEPPFKNEFWDNKKAGIYVDVVSGEPLFSSTHKFKSGTGWPSFYQPLEPANVVEVKDESHGMVRVEVRSKQANSHLGHVFTDGPKPTGLRFCINSASLRFIEAKKLEDEGLAQYLKLFGLKPKNTATVVIAAGCFWCTEAIFEAQPGVLNVVSGYAGGHKVNPTYREVCAGTTGHTEAIEITFNPKLTSFEALLKVFWKTFDPTIGNGVEPDFGSSYRPVVFYKNTAQKKVAEASKAAEQKNHKKPVKTEILPLKKFYKAEAKHQDFVKLHPRHDYVVAVSYKRMDRVGVKHP